jgi:hypothetical protein
MIIVSWMTMPLLGKRTIKRFFFSSILAVLLCSLDALIGKRRKWWTFNKNTHSFVRNEFPFLIGPMLMGSMWVLKFTYGNFKKFILVNAIGQMIFVGPLTRFFTKIKLYRLEKFNEFQFFLYFFYKSFFLYGCQYLIENSNITSKE